MPIPSGQTIVKFPPVGISASMTTFGSQNNCGGGLSVRIASPALQGYSTACAPALGGHDPAVWDASNPRYFSGTGCEAIASAVPMSGYITHAQLCIVDNGGDTVVKEYWDTGASGCPNPVPTDGSVMTGTNNTSGASLKALFDSTHFSDGAMIALKLKVWDSNGGYYDGAIQGAAYNKGFVLLNNTDESSEDAFGVARVAASIERMKHTVPSGENDKYHRDDILQLIPNESVFYVKTHASENDFGDSFCGYQAGSLDNTCNADIETTSGVDSAGRNMYHVDVTHSVLSKNANQPPYNFVFLDGCETAGTTSSSISFKFTNAFSISGQDRSYLGWHNEVFASSSENINWKIRFWDNLSYGNTALDAALESTVDGHPLGEAIRGEVSTETAISLVVLGDTATKLHGVYGRSGLDWFRPL